MISAIHTFSGIMIVGCVLALIYFEWHDRRKS